MNPIQKLLAAIRDLQVRGHHCQNTTCHICEVIRASNAVRKLIRDGKLKVSE